MHSFKKKKNSACSVSSTPLISQELELKYITNIVQIKSLVKLNMLQITLVD